MSKLKELHTPIFWAEGHPGKLNREGWIIEVGGLCLNPRKFTWQDLMALPESIADARLTSVTRFSVRGRWGGVKVADLLDTVKTSKVRDMNQGGRLRPIPNGEVIRFLDE